MQKADEILLARPINSDDDVRSFPSGEIRDAFAMRSSSSNSQTTGARSAFYGNDIRLNDGLAAGVNTVIGSAKYPAKSALIFMYHNSLGDHSIWCYYSLTDSWAKVKQDSKLNFTLENTINYARVINGLLFLTDGRDDGYYSGGERLFNPPYEIDIEASIAGDTSVVDLQDIDAAKYPPLMAPSVAYGTVDNSENRLVGLTFDFCYNYIYSTGEETTYSNVSDKPVPTKSQYTSNQNYAAVYDDNKIDVVINTGHAKVKKIKVAVRINNGNFQVFREINKAELGLSNNVAYTVTFLNNVVLYPLSNALEPYNQVPQVAKQLEILPENEIVYSNFKEDYDNVAMDYGVELRNHEILDFNPASAAIVAIGITGGLYLDLGILNYYYPDQPTIPFSFSEGDTFSLAFEYARNPLPSPLVYTLLPLSYVVTAGDIYQASLLSSVVAKNEYILNRIAIGYSTQINTELAGIITSPTTVIPNIIDPAMGYSILFASTGILAKDSGPFRDNTNPIRPNRLSGVVRTLKKGWGYKMTIQYRDAAKRSGTVQLSEDYAFQVPYPSQLDRSGFYNANNPYYVTPDMVVSNTPPVWAETYDICIQKVITSSMQRSMVGISSDPNYTGTYKIEPENFFENNLHGVINHSYQDGDRLRFVRKPYPTDLSSISEYLTTYLDLPILKYDPSGGSNGREAFWVPIFDLQLIRDNTSNSQLFEVYTPNVEKDVSPWYVIDSFKIKSAHADVRFHGGSIETPKPVTINIGSPTLVVSGDFGDAVGYYLTLEQTGYAYTGLITSATYDNANQTTILNVAGLSPVLPTAVITIDYSQTTLRPARARLKWGDNYFRQRLMGTSFDASPQAYYYVEDPYLSDFFVSNFYPFGQVAIQDTNNKAKWREQHLIHSANYVQDTNINGLGTFQGLENRLTLDRSKGPINAIVCDGKTLHVFQQSVTTPVYLSGTYNVDAVGTAVSPAFSSKTFGGLGVPITYGTMHPNSVRLLKSGYVHFYDYLNGCTVLMTPGGHTESSRDKFKMNYYFTAKTNEIRADFDNIRIFSMVDSANSEYIICFKDLTTGLAEVKVFNFDYGRWDYSHGYPVQWGESMKTVLMSTDGEQLYLHNTGAASTMYGEYYTPWLRFIFNAESKFVKRVDSLGLRTDGQWRLSGLRTLANQTYPEMTSEIPTNGFVYQEGIAWADYFRDSSNIVARLPYLRTAELALMNGRELRSIAFDHTIELVSTDANSIVSATIIYEDSRPAV